MSKMEKILPIEAKVSLEIIILEVIQIYIKAMFLLEDLPFMVMTVKNN